MAYIALIITIFTIQNVIGDNYAKGLNSILVFLYWTGEMVAISIAVGQDIAGAEVIFTFILILQHPQVLERLTFCVVEQLYNVNSCALQLTS